MNDSFVFSKNLPIRCHEISLTNRSICVFFNKRCIVSIRNKTDILTIRFICHLQSDFFCHLTDLIF